MKKHLIILLAAFLGSSIIFTSCSKDNPAIPIVTVPTTNTNVEEGLTVDIKFAVNVLGGYNSAKVSAKGGLVAIKTEPSDNATNGNIVVTFTAGNSIGAASVSITVTDKEQQTAKATALLTVMEELMVIPVTGNITINTTWKTGKTYTLENRIAVLDGITLTIEPGVVVKGQAGSGANATALIIARGATLDAQGTASSPIIFTSIADNIQPGSISSPNMDPDLNGLWGGLIILGNATISADNASMQIEGIPPSDQNGLYGGSDDNDDSGIIKYISLRHGGTNIGEGNEINGLTLGGVGSGTVIENIEIVSNQDDGIECFGGAVNVSNVLVWNQGDDAYDMDQAYKGTINNFIYIGGRSSDHGMELDGPEGIGTGSYTLTNGSLKGWNKNGKDGGEYADLRDGVTCTISNCYFFNFSENSDFELDAGKLNDDASISTNYTNGSVVFTNLEFNVNHLASGNRTIADIFSDKLAGSDVFATKVPDASIVTTPTVGADKSKFVTWTLADSKGELADF
jgi:hypothetical protein